VIIVDFNLNRFTGSIDGRYFDELTNEELSEMESQIEGEENKSEDYEKDEIEEIVDEQTEEEIQKKMESEELENVEIKKDGNNSAVNDPINILDELLKIYKNKKRRNR